MNQPRPRSISRAHFAFMRALLQGLNERESYARYLGHGENPADLRTIRGTIQWIRDEFAAAALRAARPGTARLVLMDPARFDVSTALPSLEEFAAERGMEDFSEQEQAEAYAEAYPHATGREEAAASLRSRQRLPHRARIISRQLEALRWLEDQTDRQAPNPQPGDAVTAWLNPLVAVRLEQAGLSTLALLVAHINRLGARWWRAIPGVGALKAMRVVAWLNNQAAERGASALQVAAHAAAPRRATSRAVFDAVVQPATALVPFEKLVLPPSLDGASGRERGHFADGPLAACNDHDAISAWLAAKGQAIAASGEAGRDHAFGPVAARQAASLQRLSATQRAYRKEAERLLLWCVLERKKAMSSLSADDAKAYREFLAEPPAHWCGPRYHQRWSSQWRPLEAALSAAALRHAMTVLGALFGFLCENRYVVANPFAPMARLAMRDRTHGRGHMVTVSQHDRLQARLSAPGQDADNRRLARALRWLHATEIRVGELTRARCGDLRRAEPPAEPTPAGPAWQLAIQRGGRRHAIPIPSYLVSALSGELLIAGRPSDPSASDNAHLPLLARLAPNQPANGWTASGLYKALKAALHRMAQGLDAEEAALFAPTGARSLRVARHARVVREKGKPTGRAAPTQRNRVAYEPGYPEPEAGRGDPRLELAQRPGTPSVAKVVQTAHMALTEDGQPAVPP